MLFGLNRPGLRAAPIPLSSNISSVYVLCGNGLWGLAWAKLYTSHTTLVAVPGMTPSVGPTGNVTPFSHTADTVSEAGVERTSVMDHAKVMGAPEAILKNATDVCGGDVTVIEPAGAVWGIEIEVPLPDWVPVPEAGEPPPVAEPEPEGATEPVTPPVAEPVAEAVPVFGTVDMAGSDDGEG